jgi:hypothetical protein
MKKKAQKIFLLCSLQKYKIGTRKKFIRSKTKKNLLFLRTASELGVKN